MYYSDEIIEEVRSRNDIVDVISTYVKLQKKAAHILACVRFTMKSLRLFLSAGRSRCIIVLDAVPEEMYLHF